MTSRTILCQYSSTIALLKMNELILVLYAGDGFSQILKHYGKPAAAEITRTEIQDYIIKRRETKAQRTTNGDMYIAQEILLAG